MTGDPASGETSGPGPRADHGLSYLANCSMLFTEQPLLERPSAAKAAGFDAIEFWWPWPEQPVPGDGDVDAFVGAVRDSGVQLVGLNFFAGDLAGPDCGVLSIPDRSAQFRDNIDVTVGIGEQLGASAFNALYGNRVEDATPAAAGRAGPGQPGARRRSGRADRRERARRSRERSQAVPAAHAPTTRSRSCRTCARAGTRTSAFLCDLFHLANNGDDLDEAIAEHAELVGHVQIADFPGRGEPGSGGLDLDRYLAELAGRGYSGLGRPGVQAHHRHRRRAWAGCPANGAPRH